MCLSLIKVVLSLISPALISIFVLVPIAKSHAENLPSIQDDIGIKTDENSTGYWEEVNQYVQLEAAQVTSVSQLADVQPTDWAFSALQSLVERYGCIAGYPDASFRGSRAMTRFEFAAAFSACLDTVSQGIAAEMNNIVVKEDLATLQKLQEEFAAEIATLQGRVDVLEARTEQLEKQQFSTTTKLDGQVILAVVDGFGDASRDGDGDNSNLTFSSRLRLNFRTSFTGKDELLARIQASNVINPNAPGNEARLSFQSGSDTTKNAVLSKLHYRFQLNDQISVMAATGFNTYFDDADVINPLQSDANATISRFGRYNTVYRLGGDTGVLVTYQPNQNIKAQAMYLAKNANNPGQGLLNSGYGALGQIIFYPNSQVPDTKIAFTYVNAYNEDGLGHNTGSLASNLGGRKVSSNSYGVQANTKIGSGFQLGGWLGYTNAKALTGEVRGDADIWNWAVTLAFPDLGKRGNLAGVIIGMPPKLTGTSAPLSGLLRRDPDTGFHLEGFYRYQINENISITPGFLWLTAPNHDSQNGDVFVGVIRTTLGI
ncbi:iron uptake porin [Nodularia sphaerocarpa]|uniref:iron uptake porin n=1 Tax=Nodularia sphaerocarpa TaxID=137816 RepID=UPI001EFB08C5|nr:iron uptake porin [Nodularia sphaerocarpa]ULP70954.1 hypothetical protein BDGGKGIB_00576 [Nodularia sphaerocarpa UHCC 0038]